MCKSLKLSKNKAKELRKGNSTHKSSKKLDVSVNKKKISDFYQSDEISRVNPSGGRALKILGALRYMNYPISNAYQIFKSYNPDDIVGLSSFFALRPKNVKTISKTPHNNCLCVYSLRSLLRRAFVRS